MASTIEITSLVNVTTTRMILKREMERFGQVDVCHMGNRQNPRDEPPWVRFANSKVAEDALTAIKAGQVVIDGVVITAEKSNKRGPPLHPREPRDQEFGSRELFLNQGYGGGGGGRRGDRGGRSRSRGRGRGKSRSRSRGRGRSRSRSRGRGRSRSGRRRRSRSR
mmetsp:Transcript_73655/g.159374  ORF Transcript_73655/g.159374 Transcript_73655/m.159374 type:complete len:165 (+) Transcript_73655:117-611(+)